MKFAKLLLSSMIPEWIKLYLNYKLLKTYLSSSAFIKKNLRQMKIKFFKKKKLYFERKYEILSMDQVKEKIQKDLEGFGITIKEDMIKMESFIIWKYQDIQKKNQKLKEQILFMKKQKEHLELQKMIGGDEKTQNKQQNVFKKQQYILKQTLYQFIIEISQFKNYIAINHQGLIKILKKYKKCTLSRLRNKQQEQDSLGEVMHDITLLKKLPERLQKQANHIEKLLLQNFYQLNPKKGRYNLRKYQEHKTIKGKVLFQFGLFIGFAIVLVTFIFLLRIEGQIDPDNLSNEHSIFQKMFPCFRGIALFIIYYWFLSFDLWGWTHFRINYKIYLGFNHHFSTVAEVLRRVSYLSTLFLFFFIAYILQAENIAPFDYEPYTKYLPLCIWSILLFYVFFPFTQILNGPGRIWMYKMLAGALYGHFIKYESRFTFCVDQFISMVTPLRDLDYTICYYQTYWTTGQIHDGSCFYQNRISGALIVIIPYSIKAIHYLTRARDKGKFWHTDEMWNFFKTLFAVMVATLSYLAKKNVLFRIIWIPAAACCSLFQFWWDLKKDWLFFEKGSNVRFLRNDLGYNHPGIYYAIGISNFFLRLTWILSISPDMYIYFGLSNKELFIFIIGFLEMTRRLINNFIKIEKEYITNLRSLKTTMDYQYPFKQIDVQTFQEQNQHNNSISQRISLSTLNLNEQEEDLTQLLRITSCQLEKSEQNIRNDLNKSDYLFQDYKLDLEILDKAKKQEKFQQSKIKGLKLENKEFYKLKVSYIEYSSNSF